LLTAAALERRDTPAPLSAWAFEPGIVATFGEDYRAAPLLHEGHARFAVAGGEGAGPRVTLIDAAGAELRSALVPGYAEDYRGGLDLTAAGGRVYVTPAAPGSGAVVTVLDADTLLPAAGPYYGMVGDPDYRGPLDVAVWDLTRDGRPELIALGDAGPAGTRVCVLDAATGEGLYSWYAPAHAAFAPAGLGVRADRDPLAAWGFALEHPGDTVTYRIGGAESDLYDS
jgi:hypothetical protein